MIYTVTFNPSLDYIVSMNGFEMGMTNRTTGEQMFPGGKGINVSIVLSNLGIENTALGFTAGFTGGQIEREVQKMGLLTDFIHIEKGFSRINVKLKDYDGTEINGMGPDIDQAHVDELFGKLNQLKEGDILVLAGSIPKSLPDSIYSEQELKEAQIPHRIKPLNIRKLRRRAVFAMKDQSISEGVMQL